VDASSGYPELIPVHDFISLLVKAGGDDYVEDAVKTTGFAT